MTSRDKVFEVATYPMKMYFIYALLSPKYRRNWSSGFILGGKLQPEVLTNILFFLSELTLHQQEKHVAAMEVAKQQWVSVDGDRPTDFVLSDNN